jgi:hypothetical protein
MTGGHAGLTTESVATLRRELNAQKRLQAREGVRLPGSTAHLLLPEI